MKISYYSFMLYEIQIFVLKYKINDQQQSTGNIARDE